MKTYTCQKIFSFIIKSVFFCDWLIQFLTSFKFIIGKLKTSNLNSRNETLFESILFIFLWISIVLWSTQIIGMLEDSADEKVVLLQ